MKTIFTTLAIDDDGLPAAHYPQVPFLGRAARRLTYWKCVCVFFRTSVHFNSDSRHVIVTNDVFPPVISGLAVKSYLESLGVEIHNLPFEEFKPTVVQSRIFRNNFYKLTALSYMVKHGQGPIYLFDSDVIWLRSWPDLEPGLYLYRAFERSESERIPTGISSHDLKTMYSSLGNTISGRSVEWCGGEFVGGTCDELLPFVSRLAEIFEAWQSIFDPTHHRFLNGSSIFDNDEFLLSCAACGFDVTFVSHLKRVWTESSGGVSPSVLNHSALHLPNEKLKGLSGLFDDLVLANKIVSVNLISSWCGIPGRDLHYRPRTFAARLSRGIVSGLKSVLPVYWYNRVRSLFGRPPI